MDSAAIASRTIVDIFQKIVCSEGSGMRERRLVSLAISSYFDNDLVGSFAVILRARIIICGPVDSMEQEFGFCPRKWVNYREGGKGEEKEEEEEMINVVGRFTSLGEQFNYPRIERNETARRGTS